ncbi:hypothetical protein COW53_03825 [bacterium CG17_big_fil_post_rev_8_21_14_2_50_64_8]|nr:MAG: hypothetical protein COW53_03825 [bacterium CG17_big_fil_post_rev_8_21_14_2_50_64_8]PJA73445.1 MAG: hypothetical protein CO151_13875 [bacterium CG_4_9_14_3_um_filter_65_15]
MRTVIMKFPIIMAILMVAPLAVAGNDGNQVEIHGYGGWAYGRQDSDGNNYLSSTGVGDADYVNLAVSFTSCTSEKVRLNAQVWWQHTQEEEWISVVDFAFGEYRVSDALRLRMGQVKQPFGIYTEVFDVGTIRPFFWLPQSIYGPSGIVAEAYRGVGITGSTFTQSGWSFEYDLYGGELSLEAPDFAMVLDEFAADAEDAGDEEVEEELRDFMGFRVTAVVPGSAIRLGASGYSGREETPGGDRHATLAGHLDYTGDDWLLRGEIAVMKDFLDLKSTAAYVEVARVLGKGWQVAGRWDHSHTDLGGMEVEAPSSLLDHRDVTAGLNYWFHSDFVVKLSATWVDGNRFARPEDPGAALESGTLDRTTRLVSLGAQFAF